MSNLSITQHIHEVKISRILQEFHNTLASTALELYMILEYELNIYQKNFI